jgi:hypothetical protein
VSTVAEVSVAMNTCTKLKYSNVNLGTVNIESHVLVCNHICFLLVTTNVNNMLLLIFSSDYVLVDVICYTKVYLHR